MIFRTACVLLSFCLLCAIFPHTARAEISFSELLQRNTGSPSQIVHYGTEADQFGELWLPGGHGPFPVVILIHGGCWQAALPGVALMHDLASDLEGSGFAVWNIEYRRLGTLGGGYPGTFADVADGVDYLKKLAGPNDLDLSKVVVIGHSAGGQLGLWAAGRNSVAETSPLSRKDPLRVTYVVSLAGIPDLEAYKATGPAACGGPRTIDELTGYDRRALKDVYRDTSPADMLPLHVPQLIVSGTRDQIVPENFGLHYASLAEKTGDAVETLSLEGAGHIDLIDASSVGWRLIKAKVMQALNVAPVKKF